MVQFTLPKNSKVTEGKTWPHPAKAKSEREYRVYRWNPDDGNNPRIDTYYVDTGDCGPRTMSTRRSPSAAPAARASAARAP